MADFIKLTQLVFSFFELFYFELQIRNQNYGWSSSSTLSSFSDVLLADLGYRPTWGRLPSWMAQIRKYKIELELG